ncbi:MAG TPA: TPM domain-containing protein [Sphingopyxis sp.]|uniref:TPM domain-containing protein n=1 Tax=Sphingopyxis sp. TaxID=1908224 RepID=UPI002E2F0EBC|nr:TPM domain-containing protein [Sphingopyxis sp.]HEX2813661.1 TPM domain-containing protein [Sphingopyxis sp.]
MGYTTVYDIANDSVDWQFPLIGLALILVGAVMKWGFGKAGWNSYPIMVIGFFTVLASGAVPLWDYRGVTQAVANGEARQVEGPIHDWRLVRARGKRKSTGATFYAHNERFAVGNVAFDINWGALEAGFANRGSTEEKPAVRLANGMPARIRYVPIDGPGKPPRIVRIDLGASSPADAVRQGEGGIAFRIVQGRIADEANILPADSKARLDAVLTAFDQRSGHPLVVVTTPAIGGIDIARFAATIADRRGMADSGILLLVAPNERQARIMVGRDLADRLPDTAAQTIMDSVILPRFRRGDIPGGIEAGAVAITGRATGGGM